MILTLLVWEPYLESYTLSKALGELRCANSLGGDRQLRPKARMLWSVMVQSWMIFNIYWFHLVP